MVQDIVITMHEVVISDLLKAKSMPLISASYFGFGFLLSKNETIRNIYQLFF